MYILSMFIVLRHHKNSVTVFWAIFICYGQDSFLRITCASTSLNCFITWTLIWSMRRRSKLNYLYEKQRVASPFLSLESSSMVPRRQYLPDFWYFTYNKPVCFPYYCFPKGFFLCWCDFLVFCLPLFQLNVHHPDISLSNIERNNVLGSLWGIIVSASPFELAASFTFVFIICHGLFFLCSFEDVKFTAAF